MRVTDIRERTIGISRYRDPSIPSGGLTTSLVAVVTDVMRGGRPVTGYGFASVGRYAQGGLIRERFAPRLLRAAAGDIATGDGANLDPFRAWDVMMAGEKPGGHGERCVAVGTLDMALWDAAAKIAGLPLHRFLAGLLGREPAASPVPVYASGGYPYPDDDISALREEVRRFAGLGFTHAKIKVGGAPLDRDLRRIEAAAACLADSGHLAVDAMNAYDAGAAVAVAAALERFGLWWFEDICDPLDFAAHARVAARYAAPIAAGEALFSAAEAALLDQHGGLRRDRDILLFDPVHCYGLPGYLRIIDTLTAAGWPRRAFWPHGGHLFSSISPSRSASAAWRSTRWPSTRSTGRRPPCRSRPAACRSPTSPESASNFTMTPGGPSCHSPRAFGGRAGVEHAPVRYRSSWP
jgi:L-alanine-DL-glutamate epimerase-like enolase superfamily enzyme